MGETLVHLHYVPADSRSTIAAATARASFESYGWCVVDIEGYTSKDVDPSYTIIPNGRLFHILGQDPTFFPTKLAILQNHIRFWEMVARSNSPQIYAEHDALCVGPFIDQQFEDVLVLHGNDVDNRSQVYEYPTKFEGAELINGATCYMLSPAGARKLLKEVDEGVDQGDMMINTFVVDIKRHNPPIVKTSIVSHSLGSGYVTTNK